METESRRRLAVVDELAAGDVAPDVWARTSVWLLRIALERALADLWADRAAELADARMRAQLLVLPKYLGHDDAWRVGELWYALSRGAHHHAYELTPTPGEVLTWRGEVEAAVDLLERRAEQQGSRSGG